MRPLLLGVIVGVFAVSNCVWAQSSTVAVGLVIPLTGPWGLVGNSILTGANLRIEEANLGGGLGGRKIDLHVADAGYTPASAVISVQAMTAKGVQLFIGGLTSDQALAVSNISREKRLLYIEALARADELTAKERLHQYVFRVAGNMTQEGFAATIFVSHQRAGKRLASVAVDSPYGKGVTAAFFETFQKFTPGAEIVNQKWFASNERTYAPIV